MTVIGLTGGSGVGKGYVCQKFLNLGIPSIDTDKTARTVCEPGKPCLNELVSYFGNVILAPDGTLDRRKLAEIAFSDSEKHSVLNKITHFHILNEVRLWLKLQSEKGCIAAIVDAPLLRESGFDKECDVIVAVIANRDIRIKRILMRDGITEDQALLRLSKQHEDHFYTEKADHVIVNNGEPTLLDSQVKEVYNAIKSLCTTDKKE